MSRYPSHGVSRMDSQWAETYEERNERLSRNRRPEQPRTFCPTCPLNIGCNPGTCIRGEDFAEIAAAKAEYSRLLLALADAITVFDIGDSTAWWRAYRREAEAALTIRPGADTTGGIAKPSKSR